MPMCDAGVETHPDNLGIQLTASKSPEGAHAVIGSVSSSTEDWSVEAAEIAPLLEARQLVRADAFTVFWTEASRAPRLLDRIAVERELAFRAVGEGTGRDRDRDAFDDRYLHLCAWDHERHALVGAYRVARLDASTSDRSGYAGVVPALDMLYTSTLFRFDRQLNALLSPAMELGRAFVRAPYQKHYAALMALWMGIGRLVLTQPHTRSLFGAVSIPASYSAEARASIVAFLRRHAMHRRFAELSTPRNPIPAAETIRATATQAPAAPDVDALDAQVRALDREGKGVPVLLRQYLRLGARALAFNVDHAFNDTLDVLVVVDLPNAPAALLRRYMGGGDARAYVALHANGRGHDRAA
jgi:putative hemolysin